MILPTPSAPFSKVQVRGSSVTIDVSANVLVLFTGDSTVLPKYNEYTLSGSRAALTAGTHTFTDDFNTETGLGNLIYPFIVIYDDSIKIVNFFYFSHRPKQFQFVVNASGVITQLILFPGNGVIFHGQIIYPDMKHDTDSDGIPDVLDYDITGSLLQFLKPYSCVGGTPGSVFLLILDGGSSTDTSSFIFDGGTSSTTEDVILDGGASI